MAGARDRATKARPRTTKTLAWRDADEAVLRTLRAQVAATFGDVWPQRDLVAAALRVERDSPSRRAP
jgi:hypothetical protein